MHATWQFTKLLFRKDVNGRSQWPRGLRRRSAAARLLRLWVRIPPAAWISVCCECCVLSGRGLCDELIIRTEESYRLWCVVVYDLETSRMRRSWPTGGLSRQKQTNKQVCKCASLNEISQCILMGKNFTSVFQGEFTNVSKLAARSHLSQHAKRYLIKY